MAAKRRQMTKREKKQRAKAKRELQEKGILPPDKPRMNRKKFIEDTLADWKKFSLESVYGELLLMEACVIMTGHHDKKCRISLEAVGAAKCFALAMRLGDLRRKGDESPMTVGQLYDSIKDILDA